MQHDEVVAQDTAAALEGLDITGTGVSTSGMPRAMSSDLECAQAQDDWQHYNATEQKGQLHLSMLLIGAGVHCFHSADAYMCQEC